MTSISNFYLEWDLAQCYLTKHETMKLQDKFDLLHAFLFMTYPQCLRILLLRMLNHHYVPSLLFQDLFVSTVKCPEVNLVINACTDFSLLASEF